MSNNTIKPTILFKRPEFVEETVKFPLPDGTEAVIKCKFKYMTRKEFGALWDKVSQSSQDLAKPVEGEAITYECLFDKGNVVNAANTLEYLLGWDVEQPMNADTLEQLFDEVVVASVAFWDAFRSRTLQGRSGN